MAAEAIAAAGAGADIGARTALQLGQWWMDEQARKKNWEQTLYLYNLQRQHSLEDFNRLNAYNHPLQQMQRLREAGINPIMAMGGGPNNTAQAIRASSADRTPVQPSQVDTNMFSHGLNTGMNTYRQVVETDNLKRQGRLLEREALLKDAQIAKTLQDTARSKFDLGQADRLKDLVYNRSLVDLTFQEMKMNQMDDLLDLKYRADARQSKYLKLRQSQFSQQIINDRIKNAKTRAEEARIRQAVSNLEKDGRLKQIEIELRNSGFNPNDPTYQRVVLRVLQKAGIIDSIEDGLKTLSDFLGK